VRIRSVRAIAVIVLVVSPDGMSSEMR